jgi:hypothetical protein
MWLGLLLSLIGMFGGPGTHVRADDADATALKKGSDPVWYSTDEGALVPANSISRNRIDVSDRFDRLASDKGSDPRSFSWLSELLEGLLKFIRDAWPIILLIVVTAAITLLVLFLIKIQKLVEAPGRSDSRLTSHATQQRKVTDLPFELDSPDIPLLQLIEQYRGRGDYSKAMVYLYSLMLIELDAVGLIRLTKGKTNWTYLRELSPRQEEKAYATTVVHWFEHVFFGKHIMDAQAFEAIWASFPRFNERLKDARKEQR